MQTCFNLPAMMMATCTYSHDTWMSRITKAVGMFG
jgi:hypothetical protein